MIRTSTVRTAVGHSYDRTNWRIGQTLDDNTWLALPGGHAQHRLLHRQHLNQYTAVTGLSPSYDGNGNLTGDGTYTYGYDAENRLVSASGAGNTATYAYDGRGWRKSRTRQRHHHDLGDRHRQPRGAGVRWQHRCRPALVRVRNGAERRAEPDECAGGTRSASLPDIRGSAYWRLSPDRQRPRRRQPRIAARP